MCTTFEISKVKRAKWLQIISAKKKKKPVNIKKTPFKASSKTVNLAQQLQEENI